MTTSLFYSNYDELHLLYAGGSHVSTLECLHGCFLDIMFLFCQNKLILILSYHITCITEFLRKSLRSKITRTKTRVCSIVIYTQEPWLVYIDLVYKLLFKSPKPGSGSG